MNTVDQGLICIKILIAMQINSGASNLNCIKLHVRVTVKKKYMYKYVYKNHVLKFDLRYFKLIKSLKAAILSSL